MLDQVYHFANYGVYMPTPDLPIIAHPVIALPGNLFYVLSFRAEVDGTRAEDWYCVNNQGVRPVCNCRAYTAEAGCKHCREMQQQEAALLPSVDAQLVADRAARKAARLAREAARGQNTTEGGAIVPPPTKGWAA